ncbi:MAG: hypothetical protein ACE5FO_08465 [Parvularculaceae bacterium]
MPGRTVRLTEEEDRLLSRIRKSTGWTASRALKEGLRALERDLSKSPARKAFDIYAALDLGPGGYASGPSTQSREVAAAAIKRRSVR